MHLGVLSWVIGLHVSSVAISDNRSCVSLQVVTNLHHLQKL